MNQPWTRSNFDFEQLAQTAKVAFASVAMEMIDSAAAALQLDWKFLSEYWQARPNPWIEQRSRKLWPCADHVQSFCPVMQVQRTTGGTFFQLSFSKSFVVKSACNKSLIGIAPNFA